MSLSKLNKVDREKGAIFNSHIDGKKFVLSPEESIQNQKGLGSDIVMIMDECPKKTTNYDKIKKSMDYLCIGQKDPKMLLATILKKHYLELFKEVCLKI